MPRHPPCALDNLTNTHIKKSRHKCAQKQKMLASTVQFSTTTRTEAAPHPQAKPAPTVPRDNTPRTAMSGLSSQDPTVCRQPHHPTGRTRLSGVSTSSRATPSHPHTGPPQDQHKEVPGPSTRTTMARRTSACAHHTVRCSVKLLRKEVIQPHLPVRLPCYDFVPIASPTFDRSPPCGLGHGLRVLPTFVT